MSVFFAALLLHFAVLAGWAAVMYGEDSVDAQGAFYTEFA